MSRLRLGAIALGLGLLGPILLAEEEVPIRHWSPPPYWSPVSASGGPSETTRMPKALPVGPEAVASGPATPLPFVAITPCRQYDSRNGSVLVTNTPRTVTLIGIPCGIPSDAEAVAGNITVFDISGASGNGVFKVGTVSPPTTAWINYPPTETQRANAGALPLGTGGTIVVQVNQGSGSIDFVVDVFGYYSPLGVVNTVNSLSRDVTLAPGANMAITPSGNTLTISNVGTLTGVTAGNGIAVSGSAPSPTA